jgi:hypothetical protein
MRGRIKNFPDLNLADLVFDAYFFNYLLEPDETGNLQDNDTSLPIRREIGIKMAMRSSKGL